jgi:hypothetical protein
MRRVRIVLTLTPIVAAAPAFPQSEALNTPPYRLDPSKPGDAPPLTNVDAFVAAACLLEHRTQTSPAGHVLRARSDSAWSCRLERVTPLADRPAFGRTHVGE